MLVLEVLLSVFLALILTYCIGRMFGLGFFKSFEDKFKQSARSEDHYDKRRKEDETE